MKIIDILIFVISDRLVIFVHIMNNKLKLLIMYNISDKNLINS